MISKLNQFINELRQTGYDIGTAQFLQIQKLILTLTQREEMPADLRQLKILLAPIICHSPQEQTDFYRYFNNWVDRLESKASALEPKPKAKALDSKKGTLILVSGNPLRSIPETIVNISSKVVNGCFGNGVKRISRNDCCQILVSGNPLRSIPETIVKALESKKSKNFPRLIFFFATIILLIGGIFWLTDKAPVPSPTPSAIDEKPEPIEKPEKTITPSAQPQETKTEIKTESIIIIEPGMTRDDWLSVIASLLLVPLFFLLAWLWQWGRRYHWKRFLTRVTASEQFDIEKLAVTGAEETIFQPLYLNPSAQQFYEQNQLDIEASIEKTVQTGGFPVAVTQASQTLNYLILIDRTSFADHQTKLIDNLISLLNIEGVKLSRYYFDGDPRYCYPPQAQQAPFQISELADRYPRYNLVVFSEGDGLLDPVTGEAVAWINALALWSQRLLFVLAAPEQWGERERVLEDAGFFILPANEAGLTALLEQIYTASSYGDGAAEFPALLGELPLRWLERQAPDRETVDELLHQLRQFLGDVGYYWLSTCAIYPQLLWPLTLHLGHTLTTTANHKLITTSRLVQLVRLPWFRHGYMPNWLRERLVKDLSLPQKKAIRVALENLLASALEKPASPFYLEIAKAQTAGLKAFEREQLLEDYVCVTQLAGKLSVEIPQKLRDWLKLPSVQVVRKPLSTLKLVTMGAAATVVFFTIFLFLCCHLKEK